MVNNKVKVPWIVSMVLYLIVTIRAIYISLEWFFDNYGKTVLGVAVQTLWFMGYILVVAGIFLRCKGAMPDSFSGKIPQKLASTILFVGYILGALSTGYWLIEYFWYDPYIDADCVMYVGYCVLELLAYVAMALMVLVFSFGRQTNTTGKNVAKTLWFLPGAMLFVGFCLCYMRYFIFSYYSLDRFYLIKTALFMLLDTAAMLAVSYYITAGYRNHSYNMPPYQAQYQQNIQYGQSYNNAPYQQQNMAYRPNVQNVAPQPVQYYGPQQPRYQAQVPQPVPQPIPQSAPTPVYGVPVNKAVNQNTQPQTAVDEAKNISEALTSYKELLDNGTITQEEFDKIKKDLLKL